VKKDRLVSRFCKYVECSSESGNEKDFCLLLEDELKVLGLEIKRDLVGEKCSSNGWNIYARLGGEGESILLSAHLDTVTPGKGIKPVIENWTIKSSGDTVLGSDDKAGVAAIMEMLESFVETGKKHIPIEVLFSICEENGLMGAKNADYSNIKSKRALVLDNENPGEIINKTPGYMALTFTVTGKAAHAGIAPEEGIHALKAAALAVSNIPTGNVDEFTRMNVGNFLSPGKMNIVAEKAYFEVEIRSFNQELLDKHVQNTINSVKQACDAFKASFTYEKEARSFISAVEEDADLIKEIKDAYSKLGIETSLVSSFGASDATHIFANGLEVVNLGVGMRAVHSTDEYIDIMDLESTTLFLENFCTAKEK